MKNKYIDAEKLIKSVNNYQGGAKAAFNPIEDDADYYKGKIHACKDIQEFITSLQQEQPKKRLIQVKCLYPYDESWQKNKVYTCKVWHHGDLNRDFWDVYYDYENNPKYVQFPTIELLNEEFAIIQEESQVIQEQPEVDLEKEIEKYCRIYYNCNYPEQIQNGTCSPVMPHIVETARRFWNKGYNARK